MISGSVMLVTPIARERGDRAGDDQQTDAKAA
jgi:hypothetical protein